MIPNQNSNGLPSIKRGPRRIGDGVWNRSGYIFFGFILVIFMAAFICEAQPFASCCVIDDFALVISCMALVLLSPSVIPITAASALAMPSLVQTAAAEFGLAACTGDMARRAAAAARATSDLVMASLPIVAFRPQRLGK